jgi:succinoglycan biosynthesis transport protein ExoP
METPPAKGRGFRPITSLTRHWRWSAVLGLLLCVLGLPMVWIKGQSTYNAEAVFQVFPNYQKILTGDKELEIQSNAQYREFVGQMAKSVLRRDIVEKALADPSLAGVRVCLPAETPRQCLERIQRTVYVLMVGESYMVRVGYTSGDKTLPDKLVNAIMSVFLTTVREEQIFGADDRFDVLRKQEAHLRGEVENFVRQRADLASALGLTTFTDTVANPYDSLLASTREALNQAKVSLSQANAALAAFEGQREVPMAAGRSVLDMRLQDSGLQTLRNEVIKRTEEINRALAGLEAKHPARQGLLDERREIQERLAAAEQRFDRGAMGNVGARLRASVEQAQQVEKELSARVDALTAQAGSYAATFREAMRLTSDIRKREQELTDIRDRVNFIQTEKSAVGFVRLISPALPAVTPQGPGKFKLLLALLGASMAVFLVLPTVRDMLDRRVMAVADAEKAMNMPCAAWVVNNDDASCGVLARDQIMRFASTLLRLKKQEPSGVFGLTSVKVGGGVTGLIMDVAEALIRQGARVLVVDANSLNDGPGQHSNAPGLIECLKGRAHWWDVVVSRPVGDSGSVPCIPYGQDRSSGIVRLDVLKAALARWSQHHDFVLVDLPPLLPSADAELLVDAIGQVFVVVEAMAVTKGDVVRARQQLQRQKVSSVGLVVNRVPIWMSDAGLHEQLIERISRSRTDRFLTASPWALHVQLWRLRWQGFWQPLLNKFKRT